jgi:hypothetical protein
VAAPVRKYREATEAAQTGWSLTRQVSECIPATWLVSDHPSSVRRGISPIPTNSFTASSTAPTVFSSWIPPYEQPLVEPQFRHL